MKQYGQHPLGTQPVERCLRNMLISSSRDLMVHGIGEQNARGHSVAVDVDKAPLFVRRFVRPAIAALEAVQWSPTSTGEVIEPAPAVGTIGDLGL